MSGEELSKVLQTYSAFDQACGEFSSTISNIAGWKWYYPGAAYSTRLKQAILDARIACLKMEAALEKDESK